MSKEANLYFTLITLQLQNTKRSGQHVCEPVYQYVDLISSNMKKCDAHLPMRRTFIAEKS